VKFIDAERDLSIQVHPNDEMAQREHGKMGKSEMWYIIKADPGAHLYAGFKQQITPYEYQRRVEDGSITDVLARHEVTAGDVFYLPAGRVHAICGGIMLAEVQQSSDVTYRIFDYNRPGMDGKPRELHTELAAKALDYHVEQNYRTEYLETGNRAVQIIDSPYFDVRVMEINAPFHRNLLKYDSFVISMCIEGDCKIQMRSTGAEILLREGHSTLIPAAIADYDVIPLQGKTRVLDAFIDNMDRSITGRVNRFLHVTSQ
jgi:mannose-6-phosphate isomerase